MLTPNPDPNPRGGGQLPSPDPDPNPRRWGQLPNPNECSFTLSSVTGGTYPHPDTYIYKCYLVVLNLGSSCNLREEDTHICSFINLVPRVVLEQHWHSQAIPRF